MFVVLDEEIERRLFQLVEATEAGKPELSVELTAVLNEQEDLAVVTFLDQELESPVGVSGSVIPCHAVKRSQEGDPSFAAVPIRHDNGLRLMLDVAEQAPSPLRGYLLSSESDTPEECEVDVIRVETDVFSRLKGIFDTDILASKRVSIVGLGSGGSVGALELAKAGVGNFILVDFDRLRVHNVARHVCGLADVGRFKTRAVRDMILQHSPQASVRCYEVDISDDDDLLHQIVEDSDLVLVATDTELSRYLINDACLALETPAIYGGAYERAFAGEVIRVVPGEAGCYSCVRQGLAETMRSISKQQVFDYTDDTELQAEPGMGLDVSFLAMLHAKVALMTLLRNTESSLGDIDADMIIWTNWARPEDGKLFEEPLARYFVHVKRSEDCPACGEYYDDGHNEEGILP